MTLFIQSLINGDYHRLAMEASMWLLVTLSMAVDLIFGYQKAKLRGESRTSYGLRQTVIKAIQYYALMLFGFMFDCILAFFFELPYATFAFTAFLLFIELKSVLEKARDKDKRKFAKTVEDLSVLFDNKDDLIKGLAELIKQKAKEHESAKENISNT